MTDAVARTCDHPECAKPAVRQCNFCTNSCCSDHIAVTGSGAVCYSCSQKERERREERERQAGEAQAATKTSGCLLALIPVGLLRLLLAVCDRRRTTWGRQRSY